MKVTIDLFSIVKIPAYFFILYKVWGTPSAWVMAYIVLHAIEIKYAWRN